MNRDDVFMVWAPPHGPWSAWVKPILFAHVRGSDVEPTEVRVPAPPDWTPPADGQTALVIDIPGHHGVWLALAMANTGYRPVPLYNACPSPLGSATVPYKIEELPIPHVMSSVAVDVRPIIDAIEEATWPLAKRALPIDAPPAFVLDASRRVGSGPYAPTPGSFDNRSISLPTDFPSGTLLLSRGVRRVVLVQQNTLDPQEDLAHTLLRWQQAGLRIEAVALHGFPELTAITVAKPSLFRRAWYRALATFKLVRNPLGGFGGRLPEPSSSGGGVG